jgi:hypothetical protein
MTPVEQGFSIGQRQRLRMVEFASQEDLQAKLMPGIAAWHAPAPPVHWSTQSVAKVMAAAPAKAA